MAKLSEARKSEIARTIRNMAVGQTIGLSGPDERVFALNTAKTLRRSGAVEFRFETDTDGSGQITGKAISE